jgi:hypothetical protein
MPSEGETLRPRSPGRSPFHRSLWSFAAIQMRQPNFLPTLASSHCTCMCLAPATSEYGVRASYDGLFGFLERRNEVNLAVGVARQYGLSRILWGAEVALFHFRIQKPRTPYDPALWARYGP